MQDGEWYLAVANVCASAHQGSGAGRDSHQRHESRGRSLVGCQSAAQTACAAHSGGSLVVVVGIASCVRSCAMPKRVPMSPSRGLGLKRQRSSGACRNVDCDRALPPPRHSRAKPSVLPLVLVDGTRCGAGELWSVQFAVAWQHLCRHHGCTQRERCLCRASRTSRRTGRGVATGQLLRCPLVELARSAATA